MRTNDDFKAAVLERCEKHRAERNKRIKRFVFTATPCLLVIVIGAVLVLPRLHLFDAEKASDAAHFENTGVELFCDKLTAAPLEGVLEVPEEKEEECEDVNLQSEGTSDKSNSMTNKAGVFFLDDYSKEINEYKYEYNFDNILSSEAAISAAKESAKKAYGEELSDDLRLLVFYDKDSKAWLVKGATSDKEELFFLAYENGEVIALWKEK